MTKSAVAPPLSEISHDLEAWIPKPLVKRLFEAYREIKENFYLSRHEPAELNGGKLSEVVFRILENETTGKYTPLGTQVKNFQDKCRSFESFTSVNDTIRFHIPRLLVAIYNIRNKRGVGHVGGDVIPNLADSILIATGADWIMAELLRLHYGCDLEQAQRWADGLVQRKLLLVYSVGDVKRVLNPGLNNQEKVLLFLATESPASVEDSVLRQWCEYSNLTVFIQTVLRKLHDKKLIEYDGKLCTILPTGIQVVEQNYEQWCNFSPTL